MEMLRRRPDRDPADGVEPKTAVRWGAGLVLLVVSWSASLMLVLDHFGQLGLPGCGPGSECDTALAGKWGSAVG